MLQAFFRDRRGSVGATFAITAVPALMAVGAAIDYSRASQTRASLQAMVDSAALTGARQLKLGGSATTAATNSMKAQATGLPADIGVAYAATMSDQNTVQVSATAQVKTTLMAMVTPSIPISASARATGNTVRFVELKLGNYSSSACDSNQIYFYVVPVDGSIPKSEDLTLVLSNDSAIKGPTLPLTMAIGLNDKLGFALFNTTGKMCDYGKTQYGWSKGSLHKSYSHLTPACKTVTGTGIPFGCLVNNLKTTGASECKTGNVTHKWNDMGGNVDDLDYNDMQYTFSCQSTGVDPKVVRLSQ